MADDAVAEARALLEKRCQDLLGEVKRIRRALLALDSAGEEVSSEPADGASPSIRTMLVRLLDESDRDWSANEILAEYESRGTPVHGKNPGNALRAALVDAHRKHLIFRASTGRYKAAKWNGDTEDTRREPPHDE